MLWISLLCFCGMHGMRGPLQAAETPKEAPKAHLDEKHREFFQSYCVECHGVEKQKGKLRLDNVSFVLDSVENADRWQKILNQINSGEMPPEDSKQPERGAKTRFLEALSETLVAARKSIGDAGRATVLRRVNRRELGHTLRDLLGVEADVRALPDDSLAIGNAEGEFDTFGAALFVSSDQFEQYHAIGRQAAERALAAWDRSARPGPEKKSVRTEPEIAARRQIAGLLNGYFLGGYRKAKEWEAAGAKPERAKDFGFPDEHEAKFRIRTYSEMGPYLGQYLALPKGDEGAWLMFSSSNLHDSEKVSIPADAPPGRYVLRLMVGASEKAPFARRFMEMGVAPDAENFDVLRLLQITGSIQRPQLLEIPVEIAPGGNRTFTFREKRHSDRASETFRQSLAKATNGVGLDPALWVDWFEWEGPLPEPADPERWRRLFGVEKPPEDAHPETLRKTLHHFTVRTFRGVEPEPVFVDRLMDLHALEMRAGKSWVQALAEPMAVVLASPGFIYLNEPPKTDVARSVLTDLDLASRLSYFVWSSAPDDDLLEAAKAGRLRDPAALAGQLKRMLADPRAFAFASGFTHQWLDLERLDFFRFNHQLFPEFDESTRAAARGEVHHTFLHLLRENLDARLLLKSDFVVVNPLLADYYGLPPSKGEHFQKVALPENSPRGGLPGMAAVLAMGSNGERTSPVERGAWVLRKLLHSPPPPAPPNVPQLSRLEKKAMPVRERINAHQEEPQCAQCHRKIDPIGFGFENFDAAGRWRTEEPHYKLGWVVKDGPHGKVVEKTFPIDASGAFHDGPQFDGFLQLKELLAARGDDFLRGLLENLYAYGLGRKVSFADAKTLDRLFAESKRNGAGLSDLVRLIVLSEEFHSR